MSNHGGLPDYIADHFAYLVRCSKPARYAQLAFFGLGLVLPPVGPSSHQAWWTTRAGTAVLLIILGIVFAASFIWYVSWLHERQIKFRTEMPMSYAPLVGARRRGPLRRHAPGRELPPRQDPGPVPDLLPGTVPRRDPGALAGLRPAQSRLTRPHSTHPRTRISAGRNPRQCAGSGGATRPGRWPRSRCRRRPSP